MPDTTGPGVPIPKDQIKVSADQTTVTFLSPASVPVANDLVREQVLAQEQLAQLFGYPTDDNPTSVRVSDISIDQSGNVIVTNKVYAQVVAKKLAMGGGGQSANWKCEVK